MSVYIRRKLKCQKTQAAAVLQAVLDQAVKAVQAKKKQVC